MDSNSPKRKRGRPRKDDPPKSPTVIIKKRRGRKPLQKTPVHKRQKYGFEKPAPVASMDPTPTNSPNCVLCLRECSPPDMPKVCEEQRSMIESVGGIQVDLEQDVVCRTCWKLVEMLNHFRVCCQKASEWAGERSPGLTAKSGEEWFADETSNAIECLTGLVSERTACLEAGRELALREVDCKIESVIVSKSVEDIAADQGSDKLEPESDADFGEHFLDQSVGDSEEADENEQPSAQTQKPKEAVYPCGKCKRRFDTKCGLSIHTKLCKSPKKHRVWHQCPICSADFSTKSRMIIHQNKHKGVRPYTCRKLCRKTFFDPYDRNEHETKCGTDDTVICQVCGVQLKANSLAHHQIYLHGGKAKFPCKICGKMFKFQKTVRRHIMSVHNDVREFPCQVCGKAYQTNYTLKVHMRIHTEEKPFGCDICGKWFAYKCLLKTHLQHPHNGED